MKFLIALLFLCSAPALAIINGKATLPDEPIASSVVMIFAPSEELFCTGILIHPRIVLTAGHCAFKDEKGLTVAFGTEPINGKFKARKSLKAISLSDTKDRSRGDDLALLLLTQDAPASAIAVKIPDADFPLESDLEFTAAGFGQITTEGQGPAVKKGAGILRQVNLQIFGVFPDEKIFRVIQSAGKGICHGDSGGPALMNYNNQDYVVGIASGVHWLKESQSTCAYQATYVSVLHQREWIKKNMHQLLGM